MAKKQPGLLLFYEDLEVLTALSDAQLGALIRALAFDTEVPQDLGIILAMMRTKKARYEEHYRQICEQNRRNIGVRWSRERASADESSTVYDSIQPNATEYDRIPASTDDTDEYERIRTVPSKTKTITETETTPVINKKNKDDARAREALFEEIKDGYCHGSGTLERKLRKLIDQYGEQKIREVISAGARTIWDLDFRLEHGEAEDESAD